MHNICKLIPTAMDHTCLCYSIGSYFQNWSDKGQVFLPAPYLEKCSMVLESTPLRYLEDGLNPFHLCKLHSLNKFRLRPLRAAWLFACCFPKVCSKPSMATRNICSAYTFGEQDSSIGSHVLIVNLMYNNEHFVIGDMATFGYFPISILLGSGLSIQSLRSASVV